MTHEDKMKLVDGRRRGSHLALVLIVTVTLSVCLVVTTAWLSTWLFLKSQVEMERMRLQYGHVTIDQELIDDKTSKISVYEVTGVDDKVKTKILLDGKRGIQISKIITNDGSEKCLVTLLSFSDQVKHLRPGQPIENLNMNSTNRIDVGKYRVENFLISERPILEKSMLGEQGQELCNGLTTYWTYPDFTASQQNKHQSGPSSLEAGKDTQHLHRDRRDTSMRKVGYWCYMDPTTCGYVTYPGDPYQRKYYKCDTKCEPYVPKKA